MFRKSLAAAGLAVVFMFVPTAANALDCANVSRSAYTGSDYVFIPGPDIHVHVQGNWAYVLEAGAWVFLPPGTVPEGAGDDGNFQNGEGYALLVNAICESSGAVLDNRQGDHGIQLLETC
ncbi:hypothetical protein ACJJV6_01060 [Arthrobacter nitrophenolicus]|uniref:Uncharacterized protein n=2 Tax=Arthrobacter nitrophenolicus TaxID=683150 RepID=A0ACC6TAI8_9MICC|nr:hypothetical protein [Arthrobacter nitrophenolicus]ELT44668.1 hypothetical protein G205_10453 [Arthrobacter nitrophenolicus]